MHRRIICVALPLIGVAGVYVGTMSSPACGESACQPANDNADLHKVVFSAPPGSAYNSSRQRPADDGPENLAFRADAVAIARVTIPSGEGVKDVNAIKDGVVTDQSYDSYDGANVAGEDWYGYLWALPAYFDTLIFYEGVPSEAGGSGKA